MISCNIFVAWQLRIIILHLAQGIDVIFVAFLTLISLSSATNLSDSQLAKQAKHLYNIQEPLYCNPTQLSPPKRIKWRELSLLRGCPETIVETDGNNENLLFCNILKRGGSAYCCPNWGPHTCPVIIGFFKNYFSSEPMTLF